MNLRQKIWLGFFILVMAGMFLFPPWVQVLRDDRQERHVVFLGRAPLWAPPRLTHDLDTGIPDDVERDHGEAVTNMLMASVVYFVGCWIFRTRGGSRT